MSETAQAQPDKAQPDKAEQLKTTSDGKVFGNKDTEKKYPFNPSWIKAIVVRQSQSEKLSTGEMVEIPSSVRLMPYEKDVFENLIRTDGFKGLKITIIHEPK